MDYEKAYNELIGKLRDARNGESQDDRFRVVIDMVIPELKESEDEKIRKELIAFLKHYHTGQGDMVVYDNDWIAWLEKQGEQKEYPKEVIDNAVSFLTYRNDGMPEKEARDIVNSIISIIKPEYWPRYANMQNPAWSEEDEQYLLVCKNALAKYQTIDKWDAGIISHWLEDKFKLIKERYTWKPSEQQMGDLEYIMRCYPNIRGMVNSIYTDLKKL